MDYEVVETSLQQAELMLSAAEAHGMLCGLFCVGADQALERWLEEVFADADPHNLLLKETRGLLRRLGGETEEALADADFGFQILLPDEREPLSKRAEALGAWCQGFLFGIALINREIEYMPSEDIQEVLRDLMEISRLSLEVDEDQEEAEISYTELVEYIRIAALLIWQEMAHAHRIKPETLH